MARGIIATDHIFFAEIDYNKQFFRNFSTTVARIRKLSKAINDIDLAVEISKGLPDSTIRATFSKNFSEPSVLLAADVLESWAEGMFGSCEILVSELTDAMEKILTNVSTRYMFSCPASKSGRLADVLNSQSVVVDSNRSRIAGAVINWKALERGTTRDVVRASKIAKSSLKKYPYPTPRGDISIAGYWAFMDFGFTSRTGRWIEGGHYLLDATGNYHSEDEDILDALPEFLTSRVDELNRETRDILK
jgi:hypothetical protein